MSSPESSTSSVGRIVTTMSLSTGRTFAVAEHLSTLGTLGLTILKQAFPQSVRLLVLPERTCRAATRDGGWTLAERDTTSPQLCTTASSRLPSTTTRTRSPPRTPVSLRLETPSSLQGISRSCSACTTATEQHTTDAAGTCTETLELLMPWTMTSVSG